MINAYVALCWILAMAPALKWWIKQVRRPKSNAMQ